VLPDRPALAELPVPLEPRALSDPLVLLVLLVHRALPALLAPRVLLDRPALAELPEPLD
jgi:hypothetical protein